MTIKDRMPRARNGYIGHADVLPEAGPRPAAPVMLAAAAAWHGNMHAPCVNLQI